MEGYENILKNYPEIKQVVAPADCQWDTASAQSTVESWLSAYDLDAIVCENDGMAVAPATQQVQTPVSLSQALTARRTLELFRMAVSPVRFLRTAAYGCKRHRAAVKLLKGETLDTTEIVTDNTWIDSSNVKDYE